MSLRAKIWAMGCMILAAAFAASMAFAGLNRGGNELPAEVYTALNEAAGDAQYYLGVQEGCIAVFADRRNRELLETTDIQVSTLRGADRAMLHRGIPAADRYELLLLLEDFGV